MIFSSSGIKNKEFGDQSADQNSAKQYNFVLDVEFDEEKNHIKFTVPDDSPNGSSPKFEVEAEVL